MSERDRLIELLNSAEFGVNKMRLSDRMISDDTIGAIADYLIANGVIVPTLNNGDRVCFFLKP